MLSLCAAYAVHVLYGLSPEPYIVSDSDSYLSYSDTRPHGYPILLDLYERLMGGLRYLPHLQIGLFLASVAALALAVALKTSAPALALLVFGIGAVFAPGAECCFKSVMSDAVYAAFVTFGGAFFILYLRTRHAIVLALASFAFALAAATRTIGYVPLLVFVTFLVLALAFSRQDRQLRVAAAAILPVVLVLSMTAASNYKHNGDFRIGSWGGVSLLGKGLVLAQPLPKEHPLSALNWVSQETAPAREALFDTDDLHLRMLINRQYYEYLRWFLTWDLFDQRWEAWGDAGRYRQGRLASELARAYVANDPAGYTHLVALDYASLWLLPRFLTTGEQSALSRRLAERGNLPYLTEFAETEIGHNDYFQVVPRPRHPVQVHVTRAASVGFLFLSVGAVVAAVMSSRRLPHLRGNLDVLFIVMLVHGTYAATALVEAGLERYVLPTWPLLAAGLVLIPLRLLRAAAASGSGYDRAGGGDAAGDGAPVSPETRPGLG